MLGPILVPLDGTDTSARALPVALALGRTMRLPLELVRVFEVAPGGLTGRAGPLGVVAAATAARADVQRDLEALAASLRAGDLPVTATVLDGADVAGVLLAHAERCDATVVVMTTVARGAVGRALIGSVADAVMRAAGRPVVLVPPGGHAAEPPSGGRWRVVVPLDGSPAAFGAVEFLLEAHALLPVDAVLFQAVVPDTLAVVVPPEPLIGAEVLGAQQEVAREMLEAVAARFAVRGIPVRAEVAVTSDPAQGIIEAARAASAHLVVMCTRGQGGIKRLVLGSTAGAVVRAAPIPLMLLAPE